MIIASTALVLLAVAQVAAAQPAPPSIESQSVSGVTQRTATLEARIDPGELETHYRFHLAYGCGLSGGEVCPQVCLSGQPCPGPINGPVEIPLPDATIPPSPEAKLVTLALGKAGVILQPGTRYRYSVEATNAAGTALGAPQYFTTATQPVIIAESVTDITSHDATLGAVIDPGGLVTKYKLQIDTTGHFNFTQFSSCILQLPGILCAQVVIPGEPLPAGLVEPPESTLAAGFGGQPVSLDLASIGAVLQPGTTYHYRVIAANAGPIVVGPELIFRTPGLGAEPPPIEELPDELPEEVIDEPPQEQPEEKGDGGLAADPRDSPAEVQAPLVPPPTADAVAALPTHRAPGQRTRRCRQVARHWHRAHARTPASRAHCTGIAGAVSVGR